MTLFGSEFSTAFAEVVLVTDAIVIGIVLAAAFFDDLAGICVKALHHASVMLSSLLMHHGPRK